ncbi:MAG: hypothetical protein VX466_07580 [Myxococcota bacterium]|nr:hypothetical protein [Myxococcota bacterium]
MSLVPRTNLQVLVAATLLALSTACTDEARYDQAICVLIVESGTYADQKHEVVRILKREVLPSMEPGDTLLVIRIDGESYQKENVEALMTLDTRPSRANAQKLALAKTLDELARRRLKSVHTDIPGAMMLGNEYLGELASGSRVMLVFSDMQEDLAPGTQRTLSPSEFDGIWVAAMNVKRLGSDNADPSVFRSRMSAWKRRVMQSGGLGWRTFMDASKLADYLGEVRASPENRRHASARSEGASA